MSFRPLTVHFHSCVCSLNRYKLTTRTWTRLCCSTHSYSLSSPEPDILARDKVNKLPNQNLSKETETSHCVWIWNCQGHPPSLCLHLATLRAANFFLTGDSTQYIDLYGQQSQSQWAHLELTEAGAPSENKPLPNYGSAVLSGNWRRFT